MRITTLSIFKTLILLKRRFFLLLLLLLTLFLLVYFLLFLVIPLLRLHFSYSFSSSYSSFSTSSSFHSSLSSVGLSWIGSIVALEKRFSLRQKQTINRRSYNLRLDALDRVGCTVAPGIRSAHHLKNGVRMSLLRCKREHFPCVFCKRQLPEYSRKPVLVPL